MAESKWTGHEVQFRGVPNVNTGHQRCLLNAVSAALNCAAQTVVSSVS